MICRYDYLSRHPNVFLQITGLRLNGFADLLPTSSRALRLLNSGSRPVRIVSAP